MNLMIGTILLGIALMTLFLIMSGVINKKDKIEILRVEPKDIVGLPEMIKEESRLNVGDIVFTRERIGAFVKEGAIGVVCRTHNRLAWVNWEPHMSKTNHSNDCSYNEWCSVMFRLEKIGEL